MSNCNTIATHRLPIANFQLFSKAHPGPQICVAIEISVAISTVAIDYVVITHFVIYMLQLY